MTDAAIAKSTTKGGGVKLVHKSITIKPSK